MGRGIEAGIPPTAASLSTSKSRASLGRSSRQVRSDVLVVAPEPSRGSATTSLRR
jgi:hypothetical protein